MWRVRRNKVIPFGATLLIVAVLCVWILPFTLKFSLDRHIIPAYPASHASLREIMDYYQKELAKQGMNVSIRVLDETGYDEPRDVRGIGGNGYLFLFGIERTFDTQLKCGVWRTITIDGVGSKHTRKLPGGNVRR
jgi:hypothetical protein